MEIIIRSFAMIREAIGSSRISIEVDSGILLNEVLIKLTELYPSIKSYLLNEGNISENIIITVNKKEIPYNDLIIYKITPNDEIILLPPAGGG